MAANIALLVVDVQVDFCPGGALAVRDGDKVVPKLNQLIEAFEMLGLPVFFTRDWHPPNHMSFKSQGGMWPPHCVQGTRGAEFHPDLKIAPDAVIISKGDKPTAEAYSGFQGTDLEARLKRAGVDEIFVGGLATDYCVKESALDAMEAGFRVSIMKDCVKGVNLRKNDSEKALRTVERAGATLTMSEKAIRLSRRTAIKSSS